jgi:hypothetical protein
MHCPQIRSRLLKKRQVIFREELLRYEPKTKPASLRSELKQFYEQIDPREVRKQLLKEMQESE